MPERLAVIWCRSPSGTGTVGKRSTSVLVRFLLSGLPLVGCLLLSPGQVLAEAVESSRSQTKVIVEKNTITADNSVKYVGYVPGERLAVTLEYSAGCDIVFTALTLGAPTAEIASVKRGTKPRLRGQRGQGHLRHSVQHADGSVDRRPVGTGAPQPRPRRGQGL